MEELGRACILYALLSPWRRSVMAVHVLEDIHLADDGVYRARGVEERDSVHWRQAISAQEVPAASHGCVLQAQHQAGRYYHMQPRQREQIPQLCMAGVQHSCNALVVPSVVACRRPVIAAVGAGTGDTCCLPFYC